MRKLTLLFLLVVIGIAAVGAGIPDNTKRQLPTAASAAEQPSAPDVNDPPGTVNGAKNPELVPDHVAYSLFFGFLAGRQGSETEKNSMRAYFNQTALEGVDVDALLAAADEFQQRMDAPDSAHRESILAEIIASLPKRIGASGMTKLRRHINERVKRKVKIVPGPQLPSIGHVTGQH
ncbi:MAG TPA: hypothetical protein VD861_10275 [Pyrinomonadaceae bacterium]|nr:hypothetical protein [Pyrinomonadaceae bacterium]